MDSELLLNKLVLPTLFISILSSLYSIGQSIAEGLYTWGPPSFTEGGRSESTAEPTKVQQLDGLNLTRVWAGYYYGVVLVEE